MKYALKFFNQILLCSEAFPALAARKSSVGGQAVIEGVMMKASRSWAVAVRGKAGDIHILKRYLKPTPYIFKLPLLRGVFVLIQSIALGIKAIDFSASKAYEEEEQKISPVLSFFTILVAIILGIGLFIFLPLYITRLVGLSIPMVKQNPLVFNLFDGTLRVIIFIFYVFIIGLWSDMKRIYEYHGAEHKVIHAYEKGGELNPESIHNNYSPQHPRCGTSFLMIVMVISILIFSLIPHEIGFTGKLLSRLVLIPLVAGVSYEILKISAKKQKNPFFRMLSIPGLALQKLTTRQPDREQIEVAIVSLRSALEDSNV
ncbi:MAG: DUF1385 domain-containing protein [Nitrospirae bacterium]|nr:DUF1385 domain-containing protein [Nitrospirota bacterium]